MSGTGGYLGQPKTTVPAWVKRHGYPPDKKFHWGAGTRMRNLVKKTSGLIPFKDNAPKTFRATGNHPMIWHDPDFLDQHLTPLAEAHYREAARQMDLFRDFGCGVVVELSFPSNGEHGVQVDLIL
jgi:hypothetical protein